jgi:hypothetical protein
VTPVARAARRAGPEAIGPGPTRTETTMTHHAPLVTLAGLLLAASTALAQGAGPGGAAGQGTPGTGSPRSTAPSGPPSFDEQNTPGWNSMTAAERSAHQQRMQSFRTYDACSAYMAERMRSRPVPGTTGGPAPDATAAPNDACAHLPRG